MIEIIEKPTHKCKFCGCVYSFGKEDFKKEEIMKERIEYALNRYYEAYTINSYTECPICGTKSIFNTFTQNRY